METASMLLRPCHNFYKDTFCALLPSGINLYMVPSQFATETYIQHGIDVVDILDMNTSWKLLLWAYTLLHGRCTNVSAAIKYCEENSKDNFKRILEEFIQIQSTNDQGRPIQPTQEEIMDIWIKAACIRGEFTALDLSMVSGSYSSSYCSVDLDEFEQLNRKVTEMTELYLQERAVRQEGEKRREEEDSLREEEMRRKDNALRLVTSDVKSLKSQINSFLDFGAFHVPRSPASDENYGVVSFISLFWMVFGC